MVAFGPDHFNGFFYELMPMFCIGTAAQGSKDWHLEAGPLKVPRQTALDCVRHLHGQDFDVALSHEMKVDHGITIPLYKLTGALNRYNVLPIFINCAADPRPSFRRVRNFGTTVGQFFAEHHRKIGDREQPRWFAYPELEGPLLSPLGLRRREAVQVHSCSSGL